ncbi:MAG: DUF4381 domain-containing protein [Oceanicoccus sp.]
MNVLFEEGSGWGNYALNGLVEIQLPEAVSMWPQTPGWWLLLAGLLLWGMVRAYKSVKSYWRNRYRRVALARLQQLRHQFSSGDMTGLSSVPELLKATALQAYPRANVASLYGRDWELFLDMNCSGHIFSQQLSGVLAELSYGDVAQSKVSLDDQFWLGIQEWIQYHHPHSIVLGGET